MMVRVYFESNSTDPFYNLALEQYFMEKKAVGDIYIFLWQNDKTVVIGRYQNAFEEVDINYTRENGIKIIRRNSGGGAVYHDLGNLNYSFIVDEDDIESLNYCNDIVKRVIMSFGMKVQNEGRNDLMVNGFKVSGTSEYINKGKMLHHGTLLVDSNLDVLRNVLTRRGKISDTKTTKSVVRKVNNLRSLCGQDIYTKDVRDRFCRILSEESFLEGKLNIAEEVLKIAINKFRTDDWTYGFQPKFDYQNTIRFQSGTVSVNAEIENGRIINVHFTGDFFAVGDIDAFSNAIQGKVINSKFEEIIKKNGGDQMIKGIKSSDICKLFDDVRSSV